MVLELLENFDKGYKRDLNSFKEGECGNDLDSTFRSETTVSMSILSYAEFLHYGSP